MTNVREERCDLPLRVIGGSDGPKAGIRGHRLDESRVCIEAISGAVGAVLVGYDPIEESFTHNITNFDSVAACTRPRPAVGPTVVRAGAA